MGAVQAYTQIRGVAENQCYKPALNPCSQWDYSLGKRSENRTKLRGAEAQDYSFELIGERIFLSRL